MNEIFFLPSNIINTIIYIVLELDEDFTVSKNSTPYLNHWDDEGNGNWELHLRIEKLVQGKRENGAWSLQNGHQCRRWQEPALRARALHPPWWIRAFCVVRRCDFLEHMEMVAGMDVVHLPVPSRGQTIGQSRCSLHMWWTSGHMWPLTDGSLT